MHEALGPGHAEPSRQMAKFRTHYDNLKVSRDAPPEVIRAAYRILSQKHHPDRQNGDPRADQIMAIINASYEVLSDPVKRKAHDAWIARMEAQHTANQTSQTAEPAPPPRPPPRPKPSPPPQRPRGPQPVHHQSTLVSAFMSLVEVVKVVFYIGVAFALLAFLINLIPDSPERPTPASKPYQQSAPVSKEDAALEEKTCRETSTSTGPKVYRCLGDGHIFGVSLIPPGYRVVSVGNESQGDSPGNVVAAQPTCTQVNAFRQPGQPDRPVYRCNELDGEVTYKSRVPEGYRLTAKTSADTDAAVAMPEQVEPAVPQRHTRLLGPNGEPWPTKASYIAGMPQDFTDGLSEVTVDNSDNDADVFVKLVSLDDDVTFPVRQFFIPEGKSFTVRNIRAGRYDVRYQDLNTGARTRSEDFLLEESPTDRGTQYSSMRMTLYKVQNGNMQTYPISESEF